MLNKEDYLKKIFEEVEMPLVEVLATMERHGVAIDEAALAESSKVFEADIAVLEEKIYALAGTTFNIASPKQLGEVLFDKLKLVKEAKKTKTGQYATGEEVLSKLAGEHEIVRDILEIRELQKLKSTYIDALPALLSPIDHRKAQFHQSEPPKHPHQNGQWQRDSQGFYSFFTRKCDCICRLLTDRASPHGGFQRRRNHARSLREGAGHPRRHRCQNLQSSRRGRTARYASYGQNRQFLHSLWKLRLQPLGAAGHVGIGSQRVDRCVLQGVCSSKEV